MNRAGLQTFSGYTRPSRYLGQELNSVHKDRDRAELRLALAFPDLYDLALGNLGLQVLYAILNAIPWTWAERVYAPAPDVEAALRRRGLRLGSLESGDALASLDGIGFTLQTELSCTNVLNMLDLGGIPLRAVDRGRAGPLVFCGGPGVFNPEPMAPYMDFMVVGDGEEVIVELAETMRRVRLMPRPARLEAIAGVTGVYVPTLHPVHRGPDGAWVVECAQPIVRRVVGDLDRAPHPTRPILPFTEQVHERIAIEVMRGCVRGCRFCQAGSTTRPVRERSVERVIGLMAESLAATGHGEVSLLSLSTCDHSRIPELLAQAAACARPWRASVALPSLRLDSFSVHLAEIVGEVRRAGLTFAPEAATDRLRCVINKPVQDDQLLDLAAEAAARGWEHLKLYFMVGLPTETDDDVRAIGDLSRRVLARARTQRTRVRLNLGVSTFVPKAWTPLQWAAQIGREEIRRRQALLAEALRRERAIHLGRHDPDETWVEGLIARGDRSTADLIEEAWRLGARLDGWSEHRRVDCWERALAASGRTEAASLRERDPAHRLPWDHIDPLVCRRWLEAEWRRARAGETLPDCRMAGCSGCGARERAAAACSEMLSREPPGTAFQRQSVTPDAEPVEARTASEPRARVVLRVARVGRLGLLSHLEVAAAWQRAMRRARLPLSYSQGFHAHPRVAFAAALPVGEESVDDYIDLLLDEEVDPAWVARSLAAQLPRGLHVLAATNRPLRAPALMGLVAGVTVAIRLRAPASPLAERCLGLAALSPLRIRRRTKGDVREVDLAGSLRGVEVLPAPDPDTCVLLATLAEVEGRGRLRPMELLDLLAFGPSGEVPGEQPGARILRLVTLARRGDDMVPLAEDLDLSVTIPGADPYGALEPEEAILARLPQRRLVCPGPGQVFPGAVRE